MTWHAEVRENQHLKVRELPKKQLHSILNGQILFSVIIYSPW